MSLAWGDEVPHILTRKSRPQAAEFLITSAKRLLQHYLPLPDSRIAGNSVLFDHPVGEGEKRWRDIEAELLAAGPELSLSSGAGACPASGGRRN